MRIALNTALALALLSSIACSNHEKDFDELCQLATEVDANSDKTAQQKFDELQTRAASEAHGHAKTAVQGVAAKSIPDDKKYSIVKDTAADFDLQYDCKPLEKILSKRE